VAVTGGITNSGVFTQNAGSKVKISATGGSVTAAGSGCTIASGAATCTAGELASGASQSFGATVTPNAGVTSVKTTVTVTPANAELLGDTANNTASATTSIVYTVASVAMSSAPATVRNGDDAFISTTVTNGTAPQNITTVINLGGPRDSLRAIPAGCTLNGAATVATCTAAYASNQARSFDIAVITPATPATSMTSTATATGAGGGSASGSVSTTLDPEAQAYVPAGDNLAASFPNHSSVFTATAGSGDGLFLDLKETTVPASITCDGAPCYSKAATALWTDHSPTGNLAKPYVWDINYGQLRCNGNGIGAACSDVIFYVLSNSSTAVRMPKCQASGALRNINEVCLKSATKVGNNWTFKVALLKDIAIPLLGGAKSG
jgi:hypothetical protein